jgi:hypothetical protein
VKRWTSAGATPARNWFAPRCAQRPAVETGNRMWRVTVLADNGRKPTSCNRTSSRMTPQALSLNGKLRMLKKRRPTNRNRVQRNYEKRRSSIENGPQPSGLGDGRLERVVSEIAFSTFTQLRSCARRKHKREYGPRGPQEPQARSSHASNDTENHASSNPQEERPRRISPRK